MKVNIIFILLILGEMIIITSCSTDTPVEITCDGTSILFAADVKPIIDTRCATNSNCHGTGSNRGPGALTTYTQIFQNRNQISSAIKRGTMPQGSSLSSNQASAIVCWIENGAENN